MRAALGQVHFQRVPVEPTCSFHLYHVAAWRSVTYLHYHPEIELCLFVKGHGIRLVGDSIQPFGPGDVCLLGPNLLHTWHIGEMQFAENICVQIRPETLASLASQVAECHRLRELPGLCGRGVHIGGKPAEAIADLLTQPAIEPKGSLRRLTAALLALDAACDVSTHETLSSTSAAPLQATPALSRFDRVIQTLHSQMPNPPDRSSMARLIGMTPVAFSRFFKRVVGKSYVDYVNAWRVSLACRQLLHTDQPITQIAFDCGFENLSNFHRRFRQYKQTTPRAYRATATL